MTTNRRMQALDVGATDFTFDGIPGLQWPVRRPELVAAREAFVTRYAAFVRAGWSPDSVDHQVLRILALAIYQDFLSVFAACALVSRLRAQGIEPSAGDRLRLWSTVIAGRKPSAPYTVGLLERGVPYRRWIQPFRGLFARSLSPGLQRPFTVRGAVRRGVVTLASSPLVRAHADRNRQPVALLSVAHWFAPLSPADLQRLGSPLDPALLNAVVDIAADVFQAHCESMPSTIREYFVDWIARAAVLASAYLKRITSSPKRIPRELWSGTGGNIYVRILREAVKATGGTTIGHDHGGGTGFWMTHNRNLIEFDCCDEFVTYSTQQVDGNARTLRPDLLIQPAPPKLTAVPGWNPTIGLSAAEQAALHRCDRDAAAELRNVMWVSTAYERDDMVINPLVPGVVLAEMQSRGIGALVRAGLHVLFKPHPESIPTHPPAFDRFDGIEVVSGRFEDVVDRADAFIFDWAKSTTFAHALISGRPIVWLDTGDEQLFPEAREMLARRCRIVTLERDDTGRLQLDRDLLVKAVAEASALRDQSFVDAYLHNADSP